MEDAKKKPRGKSFEKGNTYGFKKGQSGNPGGRPKRLGIAYKKLLALVDPESGLTYAELVAERVFNLAIEGDPASVRELRAATEGSTILFKNLSNDELERFIDGMEEEIENEE